MDISIVSGTYNRIAFLKDMVKSIRQSFANIHGLQYEIVLVDGGSSDGTIKWCQSQPDIKLIQHGELKGAVKAFNDGAYAATGKYVIMANDDIEFVGNSIWLAYVFMENNPLCGGGCFYQNRDGRDWHVDGMPAVTRGRKQIHTYYAQVGIFPKWLGDNVGWWCRDEDFGENLTADDYRMIGDGLIGLHTYGGDNELSAKIIDLGYQVLPIPGAKISDKEADDSLREINNIHNGSKDPRSVKGHHPDSWKWGKRWFRRNQKLGYRDLAGPIIKDKPMINNPLSEFDVLKERVLYLPLFEPGWQVLKEQKRGLRDALAKVAIVYEFDYMNCGLNKPDMIAKLFEIIEQFKPTVFLSQLHNSDQINGSDIRKFKRVLPNAKFVNWNGDYWPDQLLDSKGISLAKSFDLMTTVNRDVVEKHQAERINTQYWQIGWEPEGRGHEPEVYHDVVFLASGYSEKRQQLGKWLSEQDFNFGLYGHGWPKGMASGENLYNFQEACKVYRGAKIAIGDSQWPESGFVSNRIFQILAAGNCVLCHQWFRGIEELGLVDRVNCIIWHDLEHLEIELGYYLAGEGQGKLAGISRAGEELALSRHSFDARVNELWEMLEIGIEEYSGWR